MRRGRASPPPAGEPEGLRLELKRGADGRHVFVLRRADGSFTLQRHRTEFFPLHDLTHYAVESVLGLRRAFYGLVAEGWDLDDFGSGSPRGPLPPEALHAELIVGNLDLERATGDRLTAAQLEANLAAYHAQHGTPAAGAPVTDVQLDAIRALRDALFTRWAATGGGETLMLAWPPAE